MNCDALYERANLACLAYSTTPATWREAARQLAAFDQPDARAASDAAMMLAHRAPVVAADILAAMRGLTTAAWVETMQAENGDHG